MRLGKQTWEHRLAGNNQRNKKESWPQGLSNAQEVAVSVHARSLSKMEKFQAGFPTCECLLTVKEDVITNTLDRLLLKVFDLLNSQTS